MSSLSLPPLLTPCQEQILTFVVNFWLSRGFPPTLREVCQQFGYTAPNAVLTHYRALMKKGRLRRVKVSPKAHTVYAPTEPVLHSQGNGRGGVVVATAGGPVTFTLAAWRNWLIEQLAVAEAAE